MTTQTRQSSAANDQAAHLRELVARLDHARDARVASHSAGGFDRPRGRRDSLIHPLATRPATPPTTPPRAARVVAIASGKGGVGKTSLSVSLCASLARLGDRVVLLDGDFGLANADLLCGVRVRTHLGHVLDGACAIADVLVQTDAGFTLAPGASGLSSLSKAPVQERCAIVDQLAGIELGHDLVVIDCGAGMGDAVLSFLHAADMPIVVTTPEPTALADAYALIKCFVRSSAQAPTALRAPRLLVNQTNDESEARFASQRIAAVARRFLGVDVTSLGWTPMDSAVVDAIRSRSVFVQQAPHSDAARAVRRIARRIRDDFGMASHNPTQYGGFWRRLLRFSQRNGS